MLKISVITLFPDILQPHLQHLPLRRALEKGLLQINLVNLRDFAIDKRGTVDSPTYGGGPGMILRPEPIFDAIKSMPGNASAQIIFLTPKGKTYTQAAARKLATAEHIIFVCGRYEGMDQRAVDYFKEKSGAQEISIGNYVLSGGEVPAMVIIESVARLVPGVIENNETLENESFNSEKTEHPQYSRPKQWQGLKVPEVLLSGHHKNIKKWKDATNGTMD